MAAPRRPSNISHPGQHCEEKAVMRDRNAAPRGLRTVIYGVPDPARAKEWYSKVFGIEPYFDQPFYIGFNVGGFELGLDPNSPSGAGGTVAYWGVENIGDAMSRIESLGGTISRPAHDVGEGIKVGTVNDPFGNTIGIIENPHFDLKEVR
jgi:predicted enzyme related to lactoylglutathione lyase